MMEMIGPKPRWQYKKITMLNELNQDLVKTAEKDGVSIPDTFVMDMEDLDTACDPDDVHGWIQARLDKAEKNLADICTKVLDEKPYALKDLKKTAYLFGYRYSQMCTDALSAYQLLDNVLLNGMPCDAVNMVDETSPEKVVWHEAMDMHSKYWKDASVYREIRNEVIRGLISKSPVSYDYNNGSQMITLTETAL